MGKMDIDPVRAVEYIMKHSAEFAKAKAERVYIENYLRSKKSLIMAQAKATTISGAEAEAYAHPEYTGLLEGLKEAVEAEEKLKWMLTAAQLKVEIWRSQEATNRAIDSNAR
jgi:hypothetical protein